MCLGRCVSHEALCDFGAFPSAHKTQMHVSLRFWGCAGGGFVLHSLAGCRSPSTAAPLSPPRSTPNPRPSGCMLRHSHRHGGHTGCGGATDRRGWGECLPSLLSKYHDGRSRGGVPRLLLLARAASLRGPRSRFASSAAALPGAPAPRFGSDARTVASNYHILDDHSCQQADARCESPPKCK